MCLNAVHTIRVMRYFFLLSALSLDKLVASGLTYTHFWSLKECKQHCNDNEIVVVGIEIMEVWMYINVWMYDKLGLLLYHSIILPQCRLQYLFLMSLCSTINVWHLCQEMR